jgi:hypothetical protein
MLREPRKQAYVAYVEASRRHFDHLATCASKLRMMRSAEAEDVRDDLKQQALSLYDETGAEVATLNHLEAQVYIEGPRLMITASVDLSGKLTKFRHSLLDVLDPAEAEVEDVYAAMEDASDEAYSSYLSFLYRASDAVGIDSLRASPD